MFKRVLAIGLALLLSIASTTSVLASSSGSTPEIRITEEFIEKYGVRSVDEFGNEIIEVPLGSSQSGFTPLPNGAEREYDDGGYGVHDGHNPPDGEGTRHFDFSIHDHEVVNLSSFAYSSFVPVTSYALGGFTVTKHYYDTFVINSSLSLNGGISQGDVEAALGVSVGGSYSWGEGEDYQETVPYGYRGRIAYRYYTTMYSFDNMTTYWTPFSTTVEYDACSAEGAPYDGYYYLQLLEI